MAIKSKPAQEFVPIKEVRDGVAVMKDGSMRMILMTSTINFALKSEEEQAGILLQFQNFLNSLEFSTQIFIQSRRLDIRPYLSILNERLQSEMSELMRIQIAEYIEFIRNFTESTSIMTKTFFVIVPYYPTSLPSIKTSSEGDTLMSQFSKKKPETAQVKAAEVEAFEEARSQLEQRANVVRQGLVRTGIRVVPLGTEEIIELYYKFFNPGETEHSAKIG